MVSGVSPHLLRGRKGQTDLCLCGEKPNYLKQNKITVIFTHPYLHANIVFRWSLILFVLSILNPGKASVVFSVLPAKMPFIL